MTSADVAGQGSARPGPGRPRDHSRDALLLQATLAVLAESGYDGLTIDKVAGRVGAGRATVYRRWPTKADLVLDAVRGLSGADVGLDSLPDTGCLRQDLVAMVLPQSEDEQQYRMRILAAVAALSLAEEPRLAEAATAASVGPWITAIEALVQRAVDRGEFPTADVATLAQVIPMMCLARAVTRQPITREFSLNLVDGVLLPALRAGG